MRCYVLFSTIFTNKKNTPRTSVYVVFYRPKLRVSVASPPKLVDVLHDHWDTRSLNNGENTVVFFFLLFPRCWTRWTVANVDVYWYNQCDVWHFKPFPCLFIYFVLFRDIPNVHINGYGTSYPALEREIDRTSHVFMIWDPAMQFHFALVIVIHRWCKTSCIS